ncbi:chitin deacetylase 8-like [Tribolium madens]|uniref:chitin deacetylase 8-like n=1 Tax=Tribolium madens TaxID=41895 RepID=UPI001CF73DDE|nr:chitin deacetylase 8-like [Tribolium madens]
MKIIIFLFYAICIVKGLPPLNNSSICKSTFCEIENDCRCSSTINPITNIDDPAPQFIAITVSESVVTTLYHNYLVPLLYGRTNPDGNSIGATFYVNHEYTDYELVQKLYLHGYEIGVHSITKNSSQDYWRHASLNDLIEEFDGQREIISHFANIPSKDIRGGRTPQLQFEGDLTINAYKQSGLEYDNSWPTSSNKLLLPYTLDYLSTQECLVSISCPKESHKHFWVAPLTNIRGNNNVECNSLASCLIDGTAEEIANWLINEVDRVRTNNRAPLVLRLDSYWFEFTKNSLEGFTLFLNEMSRRNDVFFVSVQDIVDWIKNPVPVTKYVTPVHKRSAKCTPISCALKFLNGSERYMKSCVGCPRTYPWKGNPLGE